MFELDSRRAFVLFLGTLALFLDSFVFLLFKDANRKPRAALISQQEPQRALPVAAVASPNATNGGL